MEDAKAAAEQNKEKIIPSKPPADIPSIPPPTISSTTAKVNQKDKQIWSSNCDTSPEKS